MRTNMTICRSSQSSRQIRWHQSSRSCVEQKFHNGDIEHYISKETDIEH